MVHYLLYLKMYLFFQSWSLQLLIFDTDDQKFLAILDHAFICNIMKVKHSGNVFIILSCLIFCFLHVRSLLVPYANISTELIDCILLSSSEYKAIFLISSVKTPCLSLLNLCCVLNIFKIFMNSHQFLSFLKSLLYFQFEILLNSFYSPEI